MIDYTKVAKEISDLQSEIATIEAHKAAMQAKNETLLAASFNNVLRSKYRKLQYLNDAEIWDKI